MFFTTQERVEYGFYFLSCVWAYWKLKPWALTWGHLGSNLGFVMQPTFAGAAANVKVEKEKQRKQTRKKIKKGKKMKWTFYILLSCPFPYFGTLLQIWNLNP
jgi:hypothetical protein